MNKAQTGGIWLGLALTAGYVGWKNRRLFTVNDITTGESAAYPKLRSRVYYSEINQAMTAAEQVLKRLPGWQTLSRDGDNAILEAAATSSFGLWTDDVTVYFFALSHGQTRVTIRSRTRAGFGDLGRNAAHVQQLQQAMDDRLNTGAAF